MEAGYRNAVEFGKLLGKTDRMVRRYESGDTVPGVAVLQRWAELTGKSVEYFLEQPAAARAQPSAPPVHPGVEELARDRRLREALGISDEAIAAARKIVLIGDDGEPFILETAAQALDYVRLLQRDLKRA